MVSAACVLCIALLTVLSFKLYFLKKSLGEIQDRLEEILGQDTNSLLTVFSRDKTVRRFTAELNRQLGQLRRARLRYENGDREFQEAVANVSHDLRTPLTAVKGYLELVKKEEGHSPAVLRYLDIVDGRIRSMEQLTEELLRCSIAHSLQEEQAVPLALNRLLEECLIAFYGTFQKRGIRPAVQIPEAPVYRVLDASLVERVFQNIIANAVKYSPGDLSVVMTEDGSITFSNSAPNLTPVSVARLFDRYYTVETVEKPWEAACGSAPGSSAGLGLSIARLLAERMGGSMDADYQRGELHITVRFP